MMVAPARDTPGIIDTTWHKPTPKAVKRGHLLDRVMARRRQMALDQQDRDAAQHQRGDHDPRVVEQGLDEGVGERADHHGRHKREQDVAHEAELVGVMEQPGGGACEAAEIFPAHRANRAELDHHLEHLPGRLKTDEITDEDEMAGRGDRQKLGQPLDHAEQQGARQQLQIHSAGRRGGRNDLATTRAWASSAIRRSVTGAPLGNPRRELAHSPFPRHER